MPAETEHTNLAWNTEIPLRITLYPNEISTPVQLKPVYILASRQSYFPRIAAAALASFQHALASIPGQDTMRPWFDYKGLPLKWSLPVGVLYDLLVDGRDLPWELTVHLHGSPEVAIALDGSSTMRGVFFNSLKEAAYICRGSEGSSAVMQMSSASQEELWTAVQAADFQAYRRVLSGVRLTPAQRSSTSASLPIRLLLRMENDAGLLSTWELTYYTSRPVDAHHADSSDPTLLGEALVQIRPQLAAVLNAANVEPERSSKAAEGDVGAEGEAATPDAVDSTASVATKQHQLVVSVKVNGLQPPMDTPLGWLHANFHAPDYFLYVVVQLGLAQQ